jgi:predicted alpha/beta superfamily hydrolase
MANRTENVALHEAKTTSVEVADIWSSIAQAQVSSANMPKAFLGGIDTYVINSLVHKDRQFQISVALPRTYKESEKSYPVLYSLDANSEFGIMVETARFLALDEAIPELLIVGIGSPVGGRYMPSVQYRQLDYTPTELTTPEAKKAIFFPVDQPTGGAPKLLEFMRQQLMPFIEKKYRAKSDDRAIFGHSLGGLFSTYALFQSDRVFQRFLIGSPSLPWDDGVMFKVEKKYAEANTALPAKIFVSIGSEESDELGMNDYKKFVKVLKQRNYADLQWSSHIFEGETHVSVLPATISRGLRAIYSEK